jgi:hypothetical protein
MRSSGPRRCKSARASGQNEARLDSRAHFACLTLSIEQGAAGGSDLCSCGRRALSGRVRQHESVQERRAGHCARVIGALTCQKVQVEQHRPHGCLGQTLTCAAQCRIARSSEHDLKAGDQKIAIRISAGNKFVRHKRKRGLATTVGQSGGESPLQHLRVRLQAYREPVDHRLEKIVLALVIV